MICLSSELFPIILKIAWLRCVWSYSFVCVVHTLFSREKRLNNLGLFTVGFFFNYHFLIACVHLIHWLITMGSVWSLDLVYVVFPIHDQILWSCGGRKALVFLVFFLHSWIWRISKQFFIKQVLLYSWNDEVKYHFKKATFLIFWKLFKWQW